MTNQIANTPTQLETGVSSDTPKPTIRQRLTRNAEQFDEIVTELLAENARLNAALSAIPTTSGDEEECYDCPIHGKQDSSDCPRC